MSDKSVKELRKQLRAIVKESLPEVLKTELFKEVLTQAQRANAANWEVLEKHIKDVLQAIDTRSKDTLSYLVRSATTPTIKPTEEVTIPEITKE